MFPFQIGLLVLLLQTVYLKIITLDTPSEGQWPASKAKGCGYTDFNGPIAFVGNFTRYGLKLHDFNENSRITVHLNDNVSFYQLKGIRTPVKKLELKYDSFLMNKTLIWKSYREYRNIFQRGLDPNDSETSEDVENQGLYIIIIPTLSLKRDGTMKFINYVAASSDQLSENEPSIRSFQSSKYTTNSLANDSESSSESESGSSENETDSSGSDSESSSSETESEESGSSENETEFNKTNANAKTKTDRRKFLAKTANDCAEVNVQVTSIDIDV